MALLGLLAVISIPLGSDLQVAARNPLACPSAAMMATSLLLPKSMMAQRGLLPAASIQVAWDSPVVALNPPGYLPAAMMAAQWPPQRNMTALLGLLAEASIPLDMLMVDVVHNLPGSHLVDPAAIWPLLKNTSNSSHERNSETTPKHREAFL